MNVLAKQKYLFIILLIGIVFVVRLGVKDKIWAKTNTSYQFTIIKDNIETYLLNNKNHDKDWTSSGNIDSYELEKFTTVTGNTLELRLVEAVNMNNKNENSFCLLLKVKIKDEDRIELMNSIKYTNELISIDKISLLKDFHEAYWKLSSKEEVIGVGIKDLGIPTKLYDLIPKEINAELFYRVVEADDDGLGLDIYINFTDIRASYRKEIELSEIGLAKEYYERMAQNTDKNLHTVANYNFDIPLILSINNNKVKLKLSEIMDNTIRIKGSLPLEKDFFINSK